MSSYIKTIISRLSMKKVYGLFRDNVNGKMVWVYKDYYGINYMAQSKFGMRIKNETKEL